MTADTAFKYLKLNGKQKARRDPQLRSVREEIVSIKLTVTSSQNNHCVIFFIEKTQGGVTVRAAMTPDQVQ